MATAALKARRAFGLLFICVSVAVASASVASEIAYLNDSPLYLHAAIWLGSFGAVFGAASRSFRKAAPAIAARMKGSAKWSGGSKSLNGVCWAGPFVAIAAFPFIYQYLILLGIGLGNLSTYLLIRKHSGNDNREQLIVAAISLAAIPIAFAIDSTLFVNHQDVAVMLSRILIAVAYAAGGAFALVGNTKAGPVGFDPTTSGSPH
ncbi:MAG: hypothetical protein ACREA4_02285 [Nitrososphaera sp.]